VVVKADRPSTIQRESMVFARAGAWAGRGTAVKEGKMTGRRQFLMDTGALGLGIAASAGLPASSGAAGDPHTSVGPLAAGDETTPAAGRSAGLLPAVTMLSIRHAGGRETLGIKFDDGVFDVAQATGLLGLTAPSTLEQLLREGGWSQVEAVIAETRTAKLTQVLVPETSITYGRLFTNPGKIVCVGLNYRKHAQEIGMPIPKVPVLFNKFNNSLAAHNSTIKLPPRDVAYKFDYETELLVVMGRHARNVSEAEALDTVAGYCTANDFSARDLQLETGGQWMIGKTLDAFAPIGPYFVSAARVGDPNNLKLETHVNGEVRQSSNTNDFIFNVQQVISYVSRHFPLEPADIIYTGTPQGVILGMPPDKRVWLKAGDQVVSTIEKLGKLSFTLA
jgi:2-keto-4-pentenoate hydratase/2-oxohepta-3-ene-1,7-dioic acid hydratase in catechol pathway